MAALQFDRLIPPQRSDEESSDFGSDSEVDEGLRLVRVPGQHRKVTGVIERKVWVIEGLFEVTEEMDTDDVHRLLNKEQEREQKRRVSAPYNASIDITDIEWFVRSQHLSDLHEQLLRSYSVYQAKYLAKCEQEARVMENKKQLLHEELIRRDARLAVKEAVEEERSRKQAIISEMAEGRGDDIVELADTNSRLSSVHDELKESFEYIWKVVAQREEEQKRAERRRFSAELEDIERQRRILEYQSGMNNVNFQGVKSKMSIVQNELIGVFDARLKHLGHENNTKTVANMRNIDGESDIIHENKLRLENIEKVKCLMTIEQERRSTCCLSQDQLAEKMQIVEKMFPIHKQLREKFDI